MQAPFTLKPGDRVGIVAPAGKVASDSLSKAVSVISSWGLDVVAGEYILSNNHSYFSGSDEERLHDLQVMLDRPDIRAVFCARGGYGVTRILDQLDFSAFIKHPKWLIGFSDITALHLKLHSLGIESIHGPMPLHYFREEYRESIERLKNLLFANSTSTITAAPNAMNRPGHASGHVMGGNISLLADSLGTSTSVKTNGAILVLEEIGEYKYKLDRMLTQLKRSGALHYLSALVVGHMTDIKDADPGFGESVEDIILNKVKEYSYPVAFHFPIGHQAPNDAWIHGAKAKLTVDEMGSSLSFSSSVFN